MIVLSFSIFKYFDYLWCEINNKIANFTPFGSFFLFYRQYYIIFNELFFKASFPQLPSYRRSLNDTTHKNQCDMGCIKKKKEYRCTPILLTLNLIL